MGCRFTVKRNLEPGFSTSSGAEAHLDVMFWYVMRLATRSLTKSRMNSVCSWEYFRMRIFNGMESGTNSIWSGGSLAGGYAENDVQKMFMWSHRMLQKFSF